MSEDLIDGWVVFRVADDGQGIPEGFDIETANSMGLRLVRELVVKELHGDVALFREYASERRRYASAWLDHRRGALPAPRRVR